MLPYPYPTRDKTPQPTRPTPVATDETAGLLRPTWAVILSTIALLTTLTSTLGAVPLLAALILAASYSWCWTQSRWRGSPRDAGLVASGALALAVLFCGIILYRTPIEYAGAGTQADAMMLYGGSPWLEKRVYHGWRTNYYVCGFPLQRIHLTKRENVGPDTLAIADRLPPFRVFPAWLMARGFWAVWLNFMLLWLASLVLVRLLGPRLPKAAIIILQVAALAQVIPVAVVLFLP